jgi:hypothetical protein
MGKTVKPNDCHVYHTYSELQFLRMSNKRVHYYFNNDGTTLTPAQVS